MTYIAQFFAMMLMALFIENIIFTRALGTSWLLYLIKKPNELFRCTVLLTVITTLSGAVGYPLRGLVEQSEHSYILVPMMYILCIAVVYIGVYFFIKHVMPETFVNAEFNLGAAAFNCAVLGSLLVPSVGRMDFVSTVGYGLGMSLGFALAVIITGFGIERLQLCKVPKIFRGLPITLIYLGLLSLAFYGLVGHQLPT